MTISLEVLLKDSAYKLGQFKPAHINALQAAITLKDASEKPTPYLACLDAWQAHQAHAGRGYPPALCRG